MALTTQQASGATAALMAAYGRNRQTLPNLTFQEFSTMVFELATFDETTLNALISEPAQTEATATDKVLAFIISLIKERVVNDAGALAVLLDTVRGL